MNPIGITVITRSYRKVGRKAVSLFKKNTGLDVMIIEGRDDEGFSLKLQLDRLCGRRPIIFIDADFWLLRNPNWNSWIVPQKGFFGVLDSAVFNPKAFPHTDCDENGLDSTRYVNTGFFSCDLRDPDTRKVFQNARKSWRLWQRGKLKTADVTDQYHLNLALLKVPVQLLPLMFNFYMFAVDHGQVPYIPRDIIGLHGAGIPAKEKYQGLSDQYKVFCRYVRDMHDDAILNAYSKSFQLL